MRAIGFVSFERNNTVASLTGHLLWHEVDPEVVMEILLCWNRVRCRPPLDDEEVARVVEFFVTSDSSYVSGQILRVDGGAQLWPA